MSLIQHAFMQKQRVPSRDVWQQAVEALGYDLKLDPELKPFEDSGFSPCELKGNASGFEIYYESIQEYIESYPGLAEKTGDRDWAITFRWGGDLSECACVLIASAALADTSDAVIYYADDALFYDKESLIPEIKACMKEI